MGRGYVQAAHDRLRRIYETVRLYARLAARQRVPPREAFRRRRYYLAMLRPPRVPPHALSYLPDGFTVRRIARTGVSVVDNFCTPDEAQQVIELARAKLAPRGVIINQKPVLFATRTSETATVFNEMHQEPRVLPLLYRGAMLMGVPFDFIEPVGVTRYTEGQKFESHHDFSVGFLGDRAYTLLVYLNDLEEGHGGETVFEDLNFAVRPRCGRAIAWTNKNPDGTVHRETRHSARPVHGAEKWVIQLWFRRYRTFTPRMGKEQREVPQARIGEPLRREASIPHGIIVEP
jgi:prolyl 4-hydroxylase